MPQLTSKTHLSRYNDSSVLNIERLGQNRTIRIIIKTDCAQWDQGSTYEEPIVLLIRYNWSSPLFTIIFIIIDLSLKENFIE